MSVNTNIYGTSETWPIVGTHFQQGDDNNYYLADFGNGTYDKSAFKTAVDNGKLALNSGIDKTLSWCGVGNFSTLSNVEYYNRKQGDDFKMFNKDSRTITNFALLQRATRWPLASPSVNTWYYADTSNTTYGSRARWSPRALDGDTSTNSNFNMGLKPFSQIPIKNCVCVPVVHVKSTLTDVSSTTVRSAYIWDYLDVNNDVNYNTHPYIINAGFQMWGTISGTGSRSNRVINSFIAVTDNVSAGNGQPYDVSVQGDLQGDSLHLYAFGKIYSITQTDPYEWFTLFGAISSNTDFILIPTTNNITRQAGATMVLPHENAVMTEPVNNNRIYYVQYYDGFAEWLKRQIACFGLFFTDDKTTAEYGALDSELMCLGTLVNGVGNGAYTHGTDNRNQPQWNWNNTNDSTYDPSNPPEIDPNIYGVDSSFNPVSLADGALKRYVLDDDSMELLNRYLWDVIDTTDPDALIENQTLTNFLTNNPLDCIVGIKRFPFANMSQGSTTNIRLGKVTVPNTAAKPFTSDTTTLSCGSKFIPHYFEDWRSYACQFTLVLPFCGSISLPPEIVVGHWVTIKYSIDYTTGTCTAWVLCELDDGSEVVIDSASGNCSIDIPISGVQTATLNSQVYNANENLKAQKFNDMIGGAKSAMGFVGSIASGDKLAAMNSGLALGSDVVNAIHDANVAEWNINNTIIPTKMIGASSGCNSFQHELVPRLIVYKPVTDSAPNYNVNNNTYAHSVGYQCCESAKLSNYTGYAECTNVDLSGFIATTIEKNMIVSALSGGVYL